jgi:hypothetical protein
VVEKVGASQVTAAEIYDRMKYLLRNWHDFLQSNEIFLYPRFFSKPW